MAQFFGVYMSLIKKRNPVLLDNESSKIQFLIDINFVYYTIHAMRLPLSFRYGVVILEL